LIASFDVREARREISFSHAIFNRAQVALCVVTAGWVYSAFRAGTTEWPIDFLAVAAAVVVDAAINAALLVTGGRLKYSLGVRDLAKLVMLGGPGTFAVTYLSYGLLAGFFAFLYDAVGPWSFLAFVTPVVLGREVFSRTKKLVDTSDRLLEREGALSAATETISSERRDERVRIASALHDDVLQALFNVTLHAQVIREDLRTGRLLALEDDLPRLMRASDSAAQLLRDVIADLRRSPLGRRGLVDTLHLLISQLRDETKLEIHSVVSISEPSPEIQLLIYQVAREALMNAVKHAGARRVDFQLSEEPGAIRLSVEDDGVGIRTSTQDRPHFGLSLMRERTELAGGALSISCRPQGGTAVVARFPSRTGI
jgi:signal transduction histidine kinase